MKSFLKQFALLAILAAFFVGVSYVAADTTFDGNTSQTVLPPIHTGFDQVKTHDLGIGASTSANVLKDFVAEHIAVLKQQVFFGGDVGGGTVAKPRNVVSFGGVFSFVDAAGTLTSINYDTSIKATGTIRAKEWLFINKLVGDNNDPSKLCADPNGNVILCNNIVSGNDVCPNIEGKQIAVPEMMILDGDGDCVFTVERDPSDLCWNIDDIGAGSPRQTVMPRYDVANSRYVAMEPEAFYAYDVGATTTFLTTFLQQVLMAHNPGPDLTQAQHTALYNLETRITATRNAIAAPTPATIAPGSAAQTALSDLYAYVRNTTTQSFNGGGRNATVNNVLKMLDNYGEQIPPIYTRDASKFREVSQNSNLECLPVPSLVRAYNREVITESARSINRYQKQKVLQFDSELLTDQAFELWGYDAPDGDVFKDDTDIKKLVDFSGKEGSDEVVIVIEEGSRGGNDAVGTIREMFVGYQYSPDWRKGSLDAVCLRGEKIGSQGLVPAKNAIIPDGYSYWTTWWSVTMNIQGNRNAYDSGAGRDCISKVYPESLFMEL